MPIVSNADLYWLCVAKLSNLVITIDVLFKECW